jgi:hypothetical protein
MPVSGSDVFRDLQHALEDARSLSSEVQTEAQKLDAQMDELIARRGETVVELARHYLPELSRAAIGNTFTAIQHDLQQLLERKDRRVDELTEQFDRLETERQQTEHDLDVVTGRLNEKVRQREQLQQTVAAALAENNKFQSLTAQALQAEAELDRMEQRVEEITREAAEKLPAYEGSRLFQYLYNCRFGTPDYRRRGLTRRLDRWVGRLIDFYPARKSYEFLRRTPELMREEVDLYRSRFDELMSQVEDLETFAVDQAGLTQVLQEGDQLGEERDRLVAKVDAQKDRCRQVEEELLKLQQSQGQFYEQALTRFRTFLSEAEFTLLEEHARGTPQSTDDEIVGRLAWLTQQIDELEPKLRRLSTHYADLEQQSAGLDFVVRRYRQSNFDSQRSFFDDDFHVRAQIERFRQGVIDKDVLWQAIRLRQQFEPTWVEKSAGNAEQVLNSPLAHVLMHAMVEVAGAALSQSARRSVERRSEMGPGGSSRRIEIPTPRFERVNPPRPSPAPRPPTRERGFTSGAGF